MGSVAQARPWEVCRGLAFSKKAAGNTTGQNVPHARDPQISGTNFQPTLTSTAPGNHVCDATVAIPAVAEGPAASSYADKTAADQPAKSRSGPSAFPSFPTHRNRLLRVDNAVGSDTALVRRHTDQDIARIGSAGGPNSQ